MAEGAEMAALAGEGQEIQTKITEGVVASGLALVVFITAASERIVGLGLGVVHVADARACAQAHAQPDRREDDLVALLIIDARAAN